MDKKKDPPIIILFIRSLLYETILPIYALFYSLICVAAWPLPLKQRYAVVAFWPRSMVFLLRWLCGVRYTVEGQENIPKDKTGIVMSKHQSTWETFYLPSLFGDVAVILKRELKWIPFFGWGVAVTKPIAINRQDKSSAMNQVILQGKECIAEGRWILVFPEGTRVRAGTVGNYRLGGARLAVATGSDVLPIAHNAGRFWPRRKLIKRPGTIKVVIGPMIPTAGKTPEQVLEETKTWIETTMLRIDPQ